MLFLQNGFNKIIFISMLFASFNLLALFRPMVADVKVEELLVNSVTPENTITQKKARLYFSQRLTRWPDGRSVILVVLPDNNPVHIAFTKKVLGLYPYQLRRAWDRQLFTGTGQAPITVNSEQEARRIIAKTPGSLSYVSGDEQIEDIRQIEVR